MRMKIFKNKIVIETDGREFDIDQRFFEDEDNGNEMETLIFNFKTPNMASFMQGISEENTQSLIEQLKRPTGVK